MMFQMQEIGRRISELRKSRNMTQLELADRMNISFQAVSNWERGSSMPDISKLPELAQLFDVSIDELLGKKSELLRSAIENQEGEYAKKNPVSQEELLEAAPVLKPEQMQNILKQGTVPIDLSQIVDLLPFLGQDMIAKLANQAVEQSNYDELEELAPFLNREELCRIANRIYEKEDISEIAGMLPFLGEEALSAIAEKEFASNGLENFDEIAPFLASSCLKEYAKKAVEKGELEQIHDIAPFLGKEFLCKMIEEKFFNPDREK